MVKTVERVGVSKVITSSYILVKINTKLTKFIRRLNDILKKLCLVNDLYFISSHNIMKYFICQDGVHLNKDGTCILAVNFLYIIKRINGNKKFYKCYK